MPSQDIQQITNACDSVLKNKKIRSICIVDSMGNLIVEKKQPRIKFLISDKKARSLFLQSVLEILLHKDFDKQIGFLRYNISRRNKVDVITIPIYDYVVLVSVKPYENCDLIANSTIKNFEKILK
ncbi:MAG: DUF6659 family protein [Candidatus Nitrosomaritimum yanchengensis]